MADHYCKEHKEIFFKRGKMRGFSHPLEGTEPTEWCNEPEEGGDPIPEEHKDEGSKVGTKPTGRNRAFALSYSKDIACALIATGKGETYDLTIARAVAFDAYLESGVTKTK